MNLAPISTSLNPSFLVKLEPLPDLFLADKWKSNQILRLILIFGDFTCNVCESWGSGHFSQRCPGKEHNWLCELQTDSSTFLANILSFQNDRNSPCSGNRRIHGSGATNRHEEVEDGWTEFSWSFTGTGDPRTLQLLPLSSLSLDITKLQQSSLSRTTFLQGSHPPSKFTSSF